MLRYFSFCVCLASCLSPSEKNASFPIVYEEGMRLESIAEAPEIVTPIGLAIDQEDALYVLESHTHLAYEDYPGPAYDRVKKGIDENGDGIPEQWITFADSIEDGMNICLDSTGKLYVVEKDRVRSFVDRNKDHRAEEAKRLLEMVQPESVYDHAGLLGITLGPDGWLYISRGNTGGQAWKLVGTDGSFVAGYGDGGNIMRCKPDGTQLEEIATGFWNPFDLKFSQDGRLLCVDNDPDSRGPNRLVEIIPGGDYGYKSLYGGSGIHPFLAWNGELPETLPIAAALGEAPSGLLDARFSQLTPGNPGSILATIWEENSLVAIPLVPFHSSVQGEARVIIQGDSSFHPVALAVNSRGEIYMTDWVKRQYPNHGQGRLWRISAHQPAPNRPIISPQIQFQRFDTLDSPVALRSALLSPDPFLQTAAREQLRRKSGWGLYDRWLDGTDPSLQLQVLLSAMPENAIRETKKIEALLNSPDHSLQLATLRYIGHNHRTDLLPALERRLYQEPMDAEFLESYLACLRHLQPEFVEGYRNQKEHSSKNLKRTLPEGYALKRVQDPRLSGAVRSAFIPYLDTDSLDLSLWQSLIKEAPSEMQIAMVRSVENISDSIVGHTLLALLKDSHSSGELKKQILSSMAYQARHYSTEIAAWIEQAEPACRPLALKYLARSRDTEQIQQAVRKLWEESQDKTLEKLWQFYSGTSKELSGPSTEAEWVAWVQKEGDPDPGKWVFQDLQAQCQVCHKVEGWGGSFGPDLSHIGSSKSLEELIASILHPSQKMSPEWQGWYIQTSEGKTLTGRQIDVGEKYVKLLMADGTFSRTKKPFTFGLLESSLMPEGLEKRMLPEEFRDLIAYLQSLK